VLVQGVELEVGGRVRLVIAEIAISFLLTDAHRVSHRVAPRASGELDS